MPSSSSASMQISPSLFTWNTKQVFVYVTAEWPAPGGASSDATNQAVIWDSIITNPSADHLQNNNGPHCHEEAGQERGWQEHRSEQVSLLLSLSRTHTPFFFTLSLSSTSPLPVRAVKHFSNLAFMGSPVLRGRLILKNQKPGVPDLTSFWQDRLNRRRRIAPALQCATLGGALTWNQNRDIGL